LPGRPLFLGNAFYLVMKFFDEVYA
jgi:hypothetical protein